MTAGMMKGMVEAHGPGAVTVTEANVAMMR